MTEDRSKRGRGRPRTFDREKVLDTAMTLWWERGPGMLSVNALCEAIGLSKPSLYREFGGEDGLLAAALARYRTERNKPLLAKLTRESSITDAVDKLASWLTTPSSVPAGCLLAKARTTMQPLGPKATAQIKKMQTAQRSTLTNWMQAAEKRGELAEGIDPKVAARYIDTQLTALLMLAAKDEPPELVVAQTQLAFGGILAGRLPTSAATSS